jgi:hypothetical protein
VTLRRVGRFFIGLVIAIVLLGIVLPLIGIPKSHFLPPSWIYKKAEKVTAGRIVKTYSPVTNDPFKVGEHLYFIDYVFQAPDPKTGVKQAYNGTVRIADKGLYTSAKVDQRVPIRYEKTYPWINGVDVENAGLGCGEGSNILSGWLIWVLVSFVLAYIFGQILGKYGVQEDY